jgi:hypothetical protein
MPMRCGSGRVWWLAVAALALAAGCSRYPQDTPAATLASARRMVSEGHAERLEGLLYSESPGMRKVLRRLGVLLGHVQDLGRTINEKFPEEVADLRKQAEEAAKSGEASSLIGRAVMGELGGRNRPAGKRPDPDQTRASLDRFFKELFADPYGWLERSENRLSTVTIADDSAAVLWDEKPIFPPIGLSMQEEGGKWYFMLPTNLPGLSNVLPKNETEYDIWIKLVAVIDRVVIDIEKDVRSGKVRDLRALSESAGEKAFIPMAIGVVAYGKAVEAREKEAKGATPPPGTKN